MVSSCHGMSANQELINSQVRSLPQDGAAIGNYYGYTDLVPCIRRFLYDQFNPEAVIPGDQVNLDICPILYGRLKVYKSATAVYHAPSDQSGKGGMHRDVIRRTSSWRGGPAQRDSVFIENGGGEGDGFRGLLVARVLLLFSFRHMQKTYKAALVDWFLRVTEQPDNLTGMWIVAPEEDHRGQHIHAVVLLDTILRPAHLIPVYGDDMVPTDFHFTDCLDAFRAYYVNKYIDHHSHMIAF